MKRDILKSRNYYLIIQFYNYIDGDDCYMKYCIHCGSPLSNNASYCPKCGFKNQNYSANSSHSSQSPAYPKKKRKLWVTVLLWIFFWPIMFIVTLVKTTKIPKSVKPILLGAFLVFLFGAALFSSDDTEPNVSSSSPTTNNSTEFSSNGMFSETISDETLRSNFLDACQQIGMIPEKIKDFTQVDDWVSGPRFSFTYEGMPFRLYVNMDSTINTIKLGTDTDIYKQGYEPYQVSDYIVDSDITAELQIMSEDYIKDQLNYPSTADFSLLDWAFGRDHDLYSVVSTVKAQNGLGVETEMPFTFTYQVIGDNIDLLYFELDGNIVLNNMDTIPIPERKEIPDDSETDLEPSSQDIKLVDGELGEYGKYVTVDGQTYINYYIPEGTYTISNNGIWCKIYLAKDNYYENSDGYQENEIVKTLEFSNYGESDTITINEGEHLELTSSATVTLTPLT